jgi:flagellar hook-length control protein FliK
MEFLTALPPELAAFADLSARGPAPLLKVTDADGSTPATPLPFADFLALLAAPLPAGEAWPAAGKDLPLPPLEPVTQSTPPPAVPEALWALALAANAEASAPATALSTGDAAPVSAVSLADAKPAAIALPALPSAAPSDAGAFASPPAASSLEPLAALAAAGSEAAAVEVAAQRVAEGQAKAAAAPSWFESFAHERRLERPPPALAAANAPSQANALAATAAPVVEAAAARRMDAPKVVAPVVAAGDAPSIVHGDWLAPATSHTGAATTAASPPPVDVRTPNWHETFANRVQWLVDQQVGEAHIKLNPPELGAVDVKISLVDDKTFVQLTTATAAARDELSQSLPRLRELFTLSGLELGGASVQNGREGQQAAHGYGGGSAPTHSGQPAPFAEDLDEPPAYVPRRSLGRIDVFA